MTHPDGPPRILHLAEIAHWEQAIIASDGGWYRWSTRGQTLDDVGFLHASTAVQLAGVINRFYRDVDLADYLVLVIDIGLCETAGTPVRWDPVGDDQFPHLYGPLPRSAVVATVALKRSADGALDTGALATALLGLAVVGS